MVATGLKKAIVIGSGVAGLAAAIRVQNLGYSVTLFESNSFAGGKLSEEMIDGFRFDLGPSVFTMPRFLDELFTISGKNPRDFYSYIQLDPVYRYFFEDGTVVDSYNRKKKFAAEMSKKINEKPERIEAFLDDVALKYELTAEVFLYNSLHRIRHYFTKNVFRSILNFSKLQAMKNMNEVNKQWFSDKRMVQIFNRYATYNGSSPYLAPATLNVIPHLEINEGAYLPLNGMYDITRSMHKLGMEIGVKYHFNEKVNSIIIEKGKAVGVKTDQSTYMADVIISNMDVYNTYHKLMPGEKRPEKILNQPKSSSGMIFYWGISRKFEELKIHNIFFSRDYEGEFREIFNNKTIGDDPTIYLNITSKHVPADAPPGCENWFTMINVPNNTGQDWDALIAKTRENIILKLNRILKTDLPNHIICEKVFDPRTIEARTSSAFGSIYGNSSNSRFAAFLRHANFSSSIKGLYFCGGSVHPGSSIPICLLSAKITAGMIKDAM
jgi:phytoene desaturase